MASVVHEKNGRRRIEFDPVDGGGRRKLRLGKVSERTAQEFKMRVERILDDLRLGQSHGRDLCEWVKGLSTEMQQRLEHAGLMQANRRASMTLGELLDGYFETLAVKESTKVIYGHTGRNLREFFGDSRMVHTIGAADAEKFRHVLVTQEKLSAATVSRRVIVARQIFKRAVKWKVISENPFADVKGGSQRNKTRMRFVERSDVEAVLEKCPNRDWKLLVVLARYAGLRIPSEVERLTWADVDWEKSTILVHSPKTEHHEGGESRLIPLFPELRPYLLEAFGAAEDGSQFVIVNGELRRRGVNLRTQMHRIIERAGLKPWPKPFHNLRSSRETELVKEHPLQVVCSWIGNTPEVAKDHYLQVLQEDYDRASGKAAQKAAQKMTEKVSSSQQATANAEGSSIITPGNNSSWREAAESYRKMLGRLVGAVGFEPTKAEPPDLQSGPFDHFGTRPNLTTWGTVSRAPLAIVPSIRNLTALARNATRFSLPICLQPLALTGPTAIGHSAVACGSPPRCRWSCSL